MKHFIIGTAGHVDHGKTSLIKAMTGIDADRLMEEKKRGITIDLGFAYVDLPHFPKVGIVDVPGHEKFIKNMLAGVGGIDIVLLTVAADEGIMPQTKEHLDILSLLNIDKGVIVVTKTDMVDEEYLELIEEDIRMQVEGTFLENAPIYYTSSYTGEGITELKQGLDEMLLQLGEKDLKIPFRLPIDRAFTMKGFGTVVTGTVVEGQIKSEEKYMLYPDEIPVKIRGIQVHSQPVDMAYAGQRAAINLAGVAKDEIRRGFVLAPEGSMIPTMMLDVRLDVLKDSVYAIKNNSKVHVYHGSSEVLAKVVLMEREELAPGESGYAQLRFQEVIAAKKGDVFVCRFYSPLITIGGGVILDAVPVKKKRNQQTICEGMAVKEKGSDKEQLYQAVLENSKAFMPFTQLVQKAALNKQTVKNNCKALEAEKKIVALDGEIYIADQTEAKLRSYAQRFLKEYHTNNPLKEGMPMQEFRVRLLGEGREKEADSIKEYWKNHKVLKEGANSVSLWNFKVQLMEEDEKIQEELLTLFYDCKYALPVLEEIKEKYHGSKRYTQVMTAILKKGLLIKLDDKCMIHHTWFEEAKEKVIALGKESGEITLGQYRDYIDSSRKVALALLDYFDKTGVTRKNGDIRVLK